MLKIKSVFTANIITDSGRCSSGDDDNGVRQLIRGDGQLRSNINDLLWVDLRGGQGEERERGSPLFLLEQSSGDLDKSYRG